MFLLQIAINSLNADLYDGERGLSLTKVKDKLVDLNRGLILNNEWCKIMIVVWFYNFTISITVQYET